jgi:short subunit dehydrogenase-like uncharacterized protein
VSVPRGPIAVYGATGYTGRLVARELDAPGADLLLCGRSAERLRAVAADLEAPAAVRTASLDDADGLRHALGDAAVVINCAGPFTRYGERVVQAAVETATHYVDTTGEQLYMQRVFERWDDPARAAEVAVVPAVGFDYVPGDLIARLAARGREPLSEIVVAYAVSGFGATRGTLHSALEALRAGGVAYSDGAWRPGRPGPLRAGFAFPPPLGRQAMTAYPSGEVLTVPRHTRTRRVTSLITASALAPAGALAPAVPLALPGLGMALRTPLRRVADLAIDRLPEGPSPQARAAARFTIAAVAHGEDGGSSSAVVRGSDVYGLTAAIAVHAARRLAAEGFDRAGVLAPASAFDPVEFLDHLGTRGVSYEAPGAASP